MSETRSQVEYIVAPESTPLQQVVDEWLADLQLNGRQPQTIAEHRQYMARLAKWLTAQGIAWQAMSRRDMHRFLQTVATKSHSLRANLGGTMRLFWHFAVVMEYATASPAIDIKTPKRSRPVPRALSRGQIRRLLEHLKAQEGRHARRNEAMVITALYTAARASEVCRLVWEDIDIAGECVVIRTGKTGGRTVALHPELADLLTRWRELQGQQLTVRGTTPVFALDEQGEQGIKGTRLGKICSKISAALGFTVHAHALRHSAATHAIRSGAGLWNVSRMLGHSDTSTTSRTYLAADPTDSIAAVRALPNLDAW